MPFNIGPGELILILVIALVVLGPGKLPDVASSLGKSIREFRKAATDVSDAGRLDTPTAVVPVPAATPTAVAPAPAPASMPDTPADPVASAPSPADDVAPASASATATEPVNDPSRS